MVKEAARNRIIQRLLDPRPQHCGKPLVSEFVNKLHALVLILLSHSVSTSLSDRQRIVETYPLQLDSTFLGCLFPLGSNPS